MFKHLGDMKRLQSKLTARYGAEDELVLQVTHEIERLKAIESKTNIRFSSSASPGKTGKPAIQHSAPPSSLMGF